MPVGIGWTRRAAGAAALLFAAVLGGCADGGVELQGGVFDALGVSSNALSSKKAGDVTVAERQSLVIPPSTDRLPVPGEDGSVAASTALPIDPEARKVMSAAEADRRQKEVCDKAQRDAKLYGPSPTPPQGPLGPCDPSILRALTGSNPLQQKN